MSLRFADGCEHYTDLMDKWTVRDGTHFDGTVAGTSIYRHGSQSHYLGQERSLHLILPDYQDTLIAGAAFYWADQQVQTTLAFQSGDTSAQTQLRLCFYPAAARMSVRRGTWFGEDGTELARYVIPNYRGNSWYYVEFKATIHPSNGSFTVRLNGAEIMSGSGVNTANLGTSQANILQVGFLGGTPQTYVDDIYLCDAAGSVNNDFLGDVRVDSIFPSGAGTTAQWTRGGADSGANWSQADETFPNDDTDYVESGTVGNKDTYAFGNLASAQGMVFGVQVLPSLRKSDSGSRSVCSIARLSGTEVDSADKVLSSSYVTYPDIRETKPGGGAWTITDVNDAEFGIKVTA